MEAAGEERGGLSQDAFDKGRGIEFSRWIGGGGDFSRAGALSVAGCLVSAAVLSKGASLEHISIRESSDRCRLFKAGDDFWGTAELVVIIVQCVFLVIWCN